MPLGYLSAASSDLGQTSQTLSHLYVDLRCSVAGPFAADARRWTIGVGEGIATLGTAVLAAGLPIVHLHS